MCRLLERKSAVALIRSRMPQIAPARMIMASDDREFSILGSGDPLLRIGCSTRWGELYFLRAWRKMARVGTSLGLGPNA